MRRLIVALAAFGVTMLLGTLSGPAQAGYRYCDGGGCYSCASRSCDDYYYSYGHRYCSHYHYYDCSSYHGGGYGYGYRRHYYGGGGGGY